MAGAYTLLAREAHTHAETLGVESWYDQQFDPLEGAIKSLPTQQFDAIWCDVMLFMVANWLLDHDSAVPLILRDQFGRLS